MQFYDYIYRDSLIHKLDPRTKLAWLAVLSLLVFLTNSKLKVTGLFLVILLALMISRLPVKNVWNSSKLLVTLFIIAYILLFSLLLWDFKKGIVDGVFFSLKFFVLIIGSIIFAMSTSPRDLMLSLTKMKIPYEFAFMLTIAIRFIPVITRELRHVIDAQKARGHKITFSFFHPLSSLQTFVPILIPTFHLLLLKSFDLSLSVEARAFRAKKQRTYPPRLKFKKKDYASIALLLLLAAYIVF